MDFTPNVDTLGIFVLAVMHVATWLSKRKKDRKTRVEQEERDRVIAIIKKTGEETKQLSNGNMGEALRAAAHALKGAYLTAQRIAEMNPNKTEKDHVALALDMWIEAEKKVSLHTRAENEVTAIAEERDSPPAPEPLSEEVQRRFQSLGFVNVLLVEDSVNDAMLFMNAVRQLHLPQTFKTVEDGSQAIEFLFRQGKYKDAPAMDYMQLIIVDYGLQGMSGLDLITKIKADPRLALIPIVVFSGASADEEMMKRCYRVGANGCLQKPSGPDEFFRVVKDLLHYWLGLNQQRPLLR